MLVFAGAGRGFVEIFRNAENGETSAYIWAVGMSLYTLAIAVVFVWQWTHREPAKTAVQLFRSQLPFWISGAFTFWVTVEIVRRLP